MKLRLPFSCLLICIAFALCSGQEYNTAETAPSKAIKFYEAGEGFYKEKKLDRAIQQLEKSLSIAPDFIDAHILLSEVHFRTGENQQAIESMEKAMQLDSLYDVRSILALSRMYELEGNYKQASQALRSYLGHADLSPKKRSDLSGKLPLLHFRDSLVQSPVQFDPKPVLGDINTTDDEALPAISIDGNNMIFTRRNGRFENLYRSQWIEESEQWSTSFPVTRGSDDYNEGAHAISADGNIMAFTACNRRDAMGGCDIYLMIKRADGSWTAPENMQAVNSRAWDGQPAFTSDGRTLYFSSDRNGGEGKRDIWVSHRDNNDQWSRPVNLGSPVNTSGNESSPYLHYDDRTLYLMSDGHAGMGDYDLYISRHSNGTWTQPRNMGYPINTPGREGALTVHPDSHTAYYTMQSDAGTMDIYTFDLPAELRPETVSYLTGLVVDRETSTPLRSSITLFSLEDSTMRFEYVSDAQGRFDAALPHNERYGIHVRCDGYAFYSGQYDLAATEPYDKIEVKVSLVAITPPVDTSESKPIVLQNVEFETGSTVLKPESLQELRLLYDLLHKSADVRIELRGHTDDTGTPENNKSLSLGRARSVYEWLIAKGIEADRLVYTGFGQDVPVDTNTTAEGRQRNRRVEFVILGNE